MSGSAERYGRLHAVFEGARELAGEERRAYVAARCDGDEELRREVEELLDALESQATDAFSEKEIARGRRVFERFAAASSGGAQESEPLVPARIGPYRILRRHGEGGMGIVYEAEQDSPRRRIALKVVHPLFANETRVKRLRQEAELLGRLRHPGIAQIHEAGTFDLGRGAQPYFAMEFIVGTDLATYARERRLLVPARLELLARVADAVQHAHEQGVVHRDLKPDNVLVDAHGQPKVLDFGIARATEGSTVLTTLVTAEGDLLGTIAYMAPEQLEGVPDAITPRCDVYALGAIAFELLTGRPPHDVVGLPLAAAIEIVRRHEPARLGQLRPDLRGDVETIVGKALEHAPERRYDSAAALAADLRAYLEHRPIAARPPSRTYRARKFVRRHRPLVGGTAATLAALLLGLVFSLVYAVRAAERAGALATALYHAQMLVASDLCESPGGVGQLRRIVASWIPPSGERDRRGWEWRHFRAVAEPRATVLDPGFDVRAVDWHPAEAWIVAAGGARIDVRDLGSGAVRFARDGEFWAFGARWSPDGTRLAYTTFFPTTNGGRIHVLATEDWSEVWRSSTEAPYAGLVWHPDGRRLVALDFEGRLHVVEVETGSERTVEGSLSTSEGLAFDARGERLAVFRYGTVRVLETAGWTETGVWPVHTTVDSGLAWDPAGGRIATVSADGSLALIDAADGRVLRRAGAGLGGVSIAWSPDRARLATADRDYAVRLWDAATLEELDVFTGHERAPRTIAWSRAGDRLATAGEDATVRIWDLDGEPPVRSLRHLRSGVAMERGGVAWDPAGERLAVRLGDQTRVWSADGGLLGDAEVFAEWSADGARLFGLIDAAIVAWPVGAEGRPTTIHECSQRLSCLAVHPREERLVYGSGTDPRLWTLDTSSGVVAPFGEPIAALGALAWSADGTSLGVVAGEEARVLDGSSGRTLFRRTVRGAHVIACSPDGARFALDSLDHAAHVHALRDPERATVLEGHALRITALAWHPDGTRLASASLDQTVKLWDSTTGALCASFRLDAPVFAVGWSPRGEHLGAVATSGLVRVWTAAAADRVDAPVNGSGR